MKLKQGVLILVALVIFSFLAYSLKTELDYQKSITVTRIAQIENQKIENFIQEPIANKKQKIVQPAKKTIKTKKTTSSSSTSKNKPAPSTSSGGGGSPAAPVDNPAPSISNNPSLTNPIYSPKIRPDVIDQINADGNARVIISLVEGATLSDYAQTEFEEIIDLPGMNAIAGTLTKEGLDRLAQDSDMLRVEIDLPLKIATAESFPLIKADVVGNMTINNVNIDGTGQTVCVIDTGVAYGHAEIEPGCSVGQYLAGNCTKVIGGWDFFNNDAGPGDDNGHGTGLAGIVAANGSTYKGIAPAAKIVAIKITDSSGNGWTSLLAGGVDWCKNNATAFNITTILIGVNDGGQYSGTACDGGTVDTAVTAAINNNITVYAPSGNNGHTGGISFPACITNVASVAAVEDGSGTGNADDVYPNSNRGSILDLWAPGADITTITIPSGTGTYAGTSYAAAHAAGSSILVNQYNQLKYNQNPTPAQIKNILKLTGKNITDNGSGGSNLTFPRIDLLRAVNHETFAPVIPLISPSNNAKNGGSVTFSYNVTDHHNITSCSLYINSQLNQTSTNVPRGSTQTFSLTGLNPGNYNWQVQCTDNATFPNAGSSATWLYKVNYPPVLNQIPNQTIQMNSTNNLVDLSSYITDSDAGDTHTISIVAENTTQVDCGINSLNLTMTPAASYSGYTSCAIQANDGLQNSASRIVYIYVNAPPTITSTPVTTASVGTAYTYTVTATDIETLTYSLTTSPTGMTINSGTGAISWTPVSGQQGGNAVVISVSDGIGGVSTQSFTITVANQNPVITSTAPLTAAVGTAYTYNVVATDADLDTLTYSLTTSPTGMNINSATGAITWTPVSGQQGNNAVTVQVVDAYSGSTTQSFTINVANAAPVLSLISNITVNEGQLVSITPSATDADLDTLTYSFTSPLNSTGQWQTTFYDSGTYTTTVTASDAYGGSDSQIVTITVNNVPKPDLSPQYFLKQIPATPTSNNYTTFGFILANLGDLAANNITWLLDSNSTDTNANGTINSVAANSSQLVMAKINYTASGTYIPRIVLDYNNNINELNESNNINTINNLTII